MGKEFDYENMAKGFTNTLKTWIDTIAERNKLMVDQVSNERKMKSNFFYKILEQNMERQNKLKFIKEAQQQFGQGNQENGVGMEAGAPQIRVGAGGEPTLHYESPREQEAKVNLGLKYIKTKQLRYEQTKDEKFKPTDRELAFLEEHPEEIWGKEENFTEQQRADIQSSVERIRNGESNFQAEKKNLMSKYPSIGWNTLQNLSDIEKMYKPDIIKRQRDKGIADRQLRGIAIQELRKAGYPTTENNIKNAIEQLRGQ